MLRVGAAKWFESIPLFSQGSVWFLTNNDQEGWQPLQMNPISPTLSAIFQDSDAIFVLSETE